MNLAPLLVLCAYALGVLLFIFPEIFRSHRVKKVRSSRKQYLFNETLSFENQRYTLLFFFFSFLFTWNAIYFHLLPTAMTYDVVFGPVVVTGCGWFICSVRNTYRELGWDKAIKQISALFILWGLANVVDLSLIKLGAWNFDKRTTLGIIPFPSFLEKDVLGSHIQVPYVEILGFNLFIPWFILFVQMFINDIIKSPSSWKKLFSSGDPSLPDPVDSELRIPITDLQSGVCKAALAYDVRALEEAMGKLFHAITQGMELSEQDIKDILDALRKKRLFFQMQRVCEVFFKHDYVYPVVLRQMAQARIDQGNPHSAPFYLGQIDLAGLQESKEWMESKGLLGRTYKQCYVDLGKKNHRAEGYLLLALEHYRSVYLKYKSEYWHGINFVACTARGYRDKLNNRAFKLDWKKPAQEILDLIDPDSERIKNDPWKLATCLEAYVALDNPTKAKEWVGHYVSCPHEKADVFEFSSTFRQLKEVWQLDKNPKYAEVLHVLRQAILAKPGGRVTFRKEDLESNNGTILIASMQKAAQGLLRVERPDGSPVGSGFLVSGKSISEMWEKYPAVFVTANHVLDGSSRALRQEDAYLNFFSGAVKGRIHKKLWSSHDLDVAIFSLNHPPNPTDYSVCSVQDQVLELQPNQSPIYVLGYPLGNELQINCTQNHLVGYTSSYIRYKTQTWPGSSGSPVLDENWKVIGVHTEASLGEDTNQGVNIEAVIKAVNQDAVLEPVF